LQIRLFNRAQYETLDVAQILMESMSERYGSGRWSFGMVPWKKKSLLEKWMERSGDVKLCLTVDRLANCSCLVKDRGGFIKRKKEVGKKNYF